MTEIPGNEAPLRKTHPPGIVRGFFRDPKLSYILD